MKLNLTKAEALEEKKKKNKINSVIQLNQVTHARTSYHLLLQYITATVKINSNPLQNNTGS